tara:strand:+ start:45 stop:383 length:339 start_codon:yes stop_codon:yes gene_type:complete
MYNNNNKRPLEGDNLSTEKILHRLEVSYNLLKCRMINNKENDIYDSIIDSSFYSISDAIVGVFRDSMTEDEFMAFEDDHLNYEKWEEEYDTSDWMTEVDFIIAKYKFWTPMS